MFLDEAPRDSGAGPYLEMPDYMMTSTLWVTGPLWGLNKLWPYIAYPFHIVYLHRERER